eukprot:CAMPEP_0175383886 /NCGR_PEP_ID=MMETSP0095-20121207/28059_1 /TAXON_ID=311494 /ORGANISM="Alexandrium monilatum, Strain CCMP3105" /LENGTH=248 /DNA_ID=CAMNT_0016682289 /DNA_START=70 /DNA_END=813 /DNA_ORIENTATION=-
MRIAHAPRMYWPQHSSSLVPPTRCLVTAGCACQRHRLAWLMSAKPCKSTMNRFRCFNNMAFNRPGRTCLGRRTAAPNFRNGVRPFVLRYSSSQVRYSSSDLGLGASWAFGRGAVGSRGGPAAAGPSRSGRNPAGVDSPSKRPTTQRGCPTDESSIPSTQLNNARTCATTPLGPVARSLASERLPSPARAPGTETRSSAAVCPASSPRASTAASRRNEAPTAWGTFTGWPGTTNCDQGRRDGRARRSRD